MTTAPIIPTLHYITSTPQVKSDHLDRLDRFCRLHPCIILIASTGLGVLGTTILAYGDHFNLTVLSSRMISCITVSAATGLATKTIYGWKHLGSHIWHEVLNRPYEPSLNHQIYKPSILCFKNKEICAKFSMPKVTANQQIPVLEIADEKFSPYNCGYAQGYLLGSQIWEMIHQVLPLMIAEASKERNDPLQHKLNANVLNLHTYDEDKKEFRGIANGFQQWADENGVQENFHDSFMFLYNAHVLTDTYKAVGSGQALSSIGCSTLAYKDPNTKEFIVGRLLDWISLGAIGKILYIKSYPVSKDNKSMRVFSHTFPGYIGVLTGWNDRGLLVIVNELGITSRGEGTPYSLFTKHIIEQCASFKEAEEKIIEMQSDNNLRAASSFALTVADGTNAAIFHFYPGGDPKKNQNEELKFNSWSEEKIDEPCTLPTKEIEFKPLTYGVYKAPLSDGNPLIVTNHSYKRMDQYVDKSICDATSKQRLERILKANSKFGLGSAEKRVESMLDAAGEMATIGAYIFNMSNNNVRVGCDNYNAAKLLPLMMPFKRNIHL